MEKEYFFAYGTLQPDSNLRYFEENELSKYLQPLGRASVKGEIVHLRNVKLNIDYPGLVLAGNASGSVMGTLYEVHEPEAAYKIMDTHELFTSEPDSPELVPIDLFDRKMVTVDQANGSSVEAEAYVFNPASQFFASGAVEKIGTVESGDWLSYIRKAQS